MEETIGMLSYEHWSLTRIIFGKGLKSESSVINTSITEDGIRESSGQYRKQPLLGGGLEIPQKTLMKSESSSRRWNILPVAVLCAFLTMVVLDGYQTQRKQEVGSPYS